MARRDKPRYLITKSGPAGGLPRHYWEPDDRLRAEGWRPQRVPQDWARYTDAAALWTAAVARATELNLDLDRRREEAALRQVRPAPPPAQRTLGMLIRAYRASRAFTRLAPKTQRGYRQCLDRLDDWGGDAPLPAITAPACSACWKPTLPRPRSPTPSCACCAWCWHGASWKGG